jgi:hypothetical protein
MERCDEVEIKLRTTISGGAQLFQSLFCGTASTLTALRKLLCLERAQFNRQHDQVIRDEYLDTREHSCFSANVSCRIRHVGASIHLQSKHSVISASTEVAGFFRRTELSQEIGFVERDQLLESRRLPLNFARLFAAHDLTMMVACEVIDVRMPFLMTIGDQEYSLSIDRCTYFDPLSRFRADAPRLEIEIEALNVEACRSSRQLRDKILATASADVLEPSLTSKYIDAMNTLRVK